MLKARENPSPPTLRQHQEQFWSSIDPALSLVNGRAHNTSQQAGLHIYKTNVFAARLRALEQTFPLTKRYLNTCYYDVAKRYVTAIPPRNADLNLFGHYFANFIDEITKVNPPLKERPLASDLAKLEYARSEVYFSPDDLPIHSSPGDAKTSDHSLITLAPHVRLIHAQGDILGLASSLEVAQIDSTDSVSRARHYFALWRDQIHTKECMIDEPLFRFLTKFQAGITMGILRQQGLEYSDKEMNALLLNLSTLGIIQLPSNVSR